MSLLETLGLSAEAIAARRHSIGGSDANTIMSGDEARIIRLWREKRGELPGEDLSDNLAVQMGSFTEALNAAWFEKQTGLTVTDRGEVHRLDTDRIPMSCTLDGMVGDAVFEAKHCGIRNTDAELFARYVPQLTHNCIVADTARAFLSIFKGNGDWVMFEYELDDAYSAALIEAERAFWRCVQTGEPPHSLPCEVPTPKPVGVIEYDMTASNAWTMHAATYTETALAADRHEQARKELKLLVPADASKAHGHGIEIRRAKNGSLRFYEGNDE
jgi:hypothetical protein